MTTDEIFEVVDEEDRVIRRCQRSVVHRLGLRHRAVHVLVFNQAGELFLQKRSMNKDCFPGAWDTSAAGHLQPDEPYDECARRELAEELGLTLASNPTRLFKIDACVETGQEFVWVYRCEAEGPFELQPEEIECGGWFRPDDVSDWIAQRPGEFASGFMLIWEKYRAQ